MEARCLYGSSVSGGSQKEKEPIEPRWVRVPPRPGRQLSLRRQARGLVFEPMRHVAGALLCACLLALSSSAAALTGKRAVSPPEAPLTARDREELLGGSMVSRPQRFEHAGGRYVGGVSYQVVDARPEIVLAALSDVTNWPRALPKTKSARLVDSVDGLTRVELVQGSKLINARYAVVIERADAETIRFWLDPSRPHDIRDVWGFFRVQAFPGGRSLITVGAALDLGDGIARALFEDKIARMMLHAPRKIRSFIEPRTEPRVARGKFIKLLR